MKNSLVKVFSGKLCDHKAKIHFYSALSKESFISEMAVKSSHLRAACGPLLCWVGSGSAAQLASPQGCNHLRHHLLITEGCLDYHTTFNGRLPSDEYHNTQHKRYKFYVPSQSAGLLTSTQKPPLPPQSHHTVEIVWGNMEKVKKTNA